MRTQLFFAGAISLLLSVSAFARVPTGEIAKYKLVKTSERTSDIIQKGAIELTGGAFKPKEGTQGSFEVSLAYDLKVMFAGRLKGKKSFQVPGEFFTPEFMERLRKEGTIDQGIFKLKHLAIEDVETRTKTYAACDKVLAYDVKMEMVPTFDSLINETFGAAYLSNIEDPIDVKLGSAKKVEGIFYISSEVPVMGAVKIDVSGIVQGIFIKAGFDYVHPSSTGQDQEQ